MREYIKYREPKMIIYKRCHNFCECSYAKLILISLTFSYLCDGISFAIIIKSKYIKYNMEKNYRGSIIFKPVLLNMIIKRKYSVTLYI